jgi:hypothetical protein
MSAPLRNETVGDAAHLPSQPLHGQLRDTEGLFDVPARHAVALVALITVTLAATVFFLEDLRGRVGCAPPL